MTKKQQGPLLLIVLAVAGFAMLYKRSKTNSYTPSIPNPQLHSGGGNSTVNTVTGILSGIAGIWGNLTKTGIFDSSSSETTNNNIGRLPDTAGSGYPDGVTGGGMLS